MTKFVLFFGLILLGTIILSGAVSAVTIGTHHNTIAQSNKLTLSPIGTVNAQTKIHLNTKSPTSNSLITNKNQKLPDPTVIRGGVIIGSYTSIALACDAALDGDTIMLDPGTYNEHGLNINKNLDFKVSNNGHATIDGGNVETVFNINSGVTATFQNLTIQNGNTNYYGGAINNMGNLTVTSCSFKVNTAYDGGGAIYNGGKLTINNCSFTDNNATNYAGGAIYNGVGSTLNMTKSTFTRNNAIYYGGAIHNLGYMTITSSKFDRNTAPYGVGGAIYSTGNVNVNLSTFTSNTCNIGGGAGAIGSKGVMKITGSNFYNNKCTYGGAIGNIEGIMSIKSCTFKGNNATQESNGNGGAIFNSGNLTVINNNFINNTSIFGGAIFNTNILNVTSNNFINNSAIYGGAFYNSNGNSIIHFNVIVRNTANIGSAIDNDGGTVNATLNWWGTNKGPASGNLVGTIVHSWMVLKLYASPTSIGNNGHSTITADLRYNNQGIYAGGYLPNGLLVTFKTNLGTITQASTKNGIAQSTLKSGVTAGKATISAYLNSQITSTSVLVKDTIAPKIVLTSPKNGAKGISRTATIQIKFTENIKASTAYNNIIIKNLSTGKYVSVTKAISGNSLFIKTTLKRSKYAWYSVTIPKSAVKDTSGNHFATNYTFTFKTGS